MWHYLNKVFVMQHEIPAVSSGLASSAKILFCKQTMECATQNPFIWCLTMVFKQIKQYFTKTCSVPLTQVMACLELGSLEQSSNLTGDRSEKKRLMGKYQPLIRCRRKSLTFSTEAEMSIYHLCSLVLCPLVPCAFFCDLIKQQPKRVWFQTLYLELRQSTGDAASPSSQKLSSAAPVRPSVR